MRRMVNQGSMRQKPKARCARGTHRSATAGPPQVSPAPRQPKRTVRLVEELRRNSHHNGLARAGPGRRSHRLRCSVYYVRGLSLTHAPVGPISCERSCAPSEMDHGRGSETAHATEMLPRSRKISDRMAESSEETARYSTSMVTSSG